MTIPSSSTNEKKRIPRTPNTKFMSDQARVEKVTRRFMNMTLKELGKLQTGPDKSYITEIIRSVIGIGNTDYHTRLSPEKLQDMTYVELACLIRDPRVAAPLNAYLNMAYLLIAGKEVSAQVKMFLSIPIRSFFCYLDSISEIPCLLEQLRYITDRCAYDDSYTIEDFIMEKYAEVNQPWWINMPIEIYEQNITGAYLDIGDLLFDGFQKTFSGKYPVRSICGKYVDDENSPLAGEPGPDTAETDPADIEEVLDLTNIDSGFPRIFNLR